MISLIAVGDIMPGGVLHGQNVKYISKEVMQILASGDIRVGTLECAIGNEPTFYVEKMKREKDVIYAKDKDLLRVKELGINVVSLANNHFFDLGEDGARHTIEQLDSLNILHCGAGKNIGEAAKPAVVMIDGKTVAFLAFCDYRQETVGFVPFATDTEAGVNPMYEDYVVKEIKSNKSKYDYVIVIPHWGVEHTYFPCVSVYRLANKMLEAGANCILGGHTHRIQSVVENRKGTIVYSMGNFLFPDRYIVPPRSTWYPPKNFNTVDLPKTYRYPYVKVPTLKLWNNLSRIGMIVNIGLTNEKIKVDYQLTILSKDNSISVLGISSSRYKRILGCIGLFLKTRSYPVLYFIYRVRKSLISRVVQRCYK